MTGSARNLEVKSRGSIADKHQETTMTTSISVRDAKLADVPAMKLIIDSTALFPSAMLDDMTAPFFGGNRGDEIWLILERMGLPVGLAYCAPERMTEGTNNLLLIAVDKPSRGSGYGTVLLTALERRLKERGGRVLLVETSGLPEFEATRRFYDKNGYVQEARIRDFYKAGEDKVVFWKRVQE
jgi:ribosomal protein S18 acetylase RimI-like enzyme